MEYKCSDCREIFDSFLPWRARDGEVLCGTCWRLTATPEEKLSDFDKRAAMQFQRDLRKVDYAGIAVPPPADQRKLDVGAADLRREALGFPAARTGGRAAEIAKKRCAPSPFDKSRAASLAAYVMTGDGTDGPIPGPGDVTPDEAVAPWPSPPVTEDELAGDDPWTERARGRINDAQFVRPGSFGFEQEAGAEIPESWRRVSEEIKADRETCPVDRPAHYNQGGVECLDAMRAAFGDEALATYAHVNAFKYVWRARYKNGDEDLRKAVFYLRVALGEDPR